MQLFLQVYVKKLKQRGHDIELLTTFPPVSDSVGKQDGEICGVGDPRREGAANGF